MTLYVWIRSLDCNDGRDENSCPPSNSVTSLLSNLGEFLIVGYAHNLLINFCISHHPMTRESQVGGCRHTQHGQPPFGITSLILLQSGLIISNMDYSSALIRKSSTGQLITGCDFPFPIIGISLFMENGSVLTVAYNSGLSGLADSIFIWVHNCK